MTRPDPQTVTPLTDDNGPVFDEPWHAQVLALADTMIKAGHFAYTDWATTLGAALATAKDRDAPDTTETYYQCAVEALEQLVAQNTPINPAAMSERKDAWARAYLATPHGKPIELKAGLANPSK